MDLKENQMGNILSILPAAGFGVRMHVGRTDAKEMLLDPITGSPLMDWDLDLCLDNDIKSLVITRADKLGLINHITNRENLSALILEKPVGEWPDTILASKQLWEDDNILLLPDTRFNDADNIVKKIKQSLEQGHELVVAYHKVDDLSKWGAIHDGAVGLSIEEKPERLKDTKGIAWGIIGFKRYIGDNLFKAMSRKIPFICPESTILLELDWFKDITRTGKLEKY